MLQNMREGAAKWIGWVIIILVVITMTLWGISSYFTGGDSSAPAVAKINGAKITQQSFFNQLNRLRQQNPKLFSTPGSEKMVKQQLLQQMIQQQVLAQAAMKQGFTISQSQLTGFVAQIPAFQVDGKFSQVRFQAVLSAALYSEGEFLNQTRDGLLIQQLTSGVENTSFVLPHEVERFVGLTQQKRNIGYAIIPAAKFKNSVKVTSAQIQNYYQQHQAEFTVPEKVSIEYLRIDPKAVASSIKPSTAELKDFYQNNISAYTRPTRWHVAHIVLHVPENATAKQLGALKAKLADIRQQALKGKSFSSLAKQYSQDIFSAKNGGEIKWFTAGTLGPVFEQTAAALKPGQISEPVQTRYGYELIKLIAVQKQTAKSFAVVKTEVTKGYISQKLQKIIADKNEQLANVTFENPNSLAPVAKQLGLTIQTTPLFARAGLQIGIAKNPQVVSAAFSTDVLENGNNSDVLTLKDNSLVVVRVKKHVAQTVKPLSQVSKQVRAMIAAEQASQAAANLGHQLLIAAEKGNQVASVLMNKGIQWHTASNVEQATKNINPMILAKAFTMSAPQAENSYRLQGLSLGNGDFAVIGVSKVMLGNATVMKKLERQLYQQQLRILEGQMTFSAYTKAQQAKAKIEKYEKNLTR